jgi:Flp pilus assembly pilin Flp
MKAIIRKFLRAENGAVTVDWVVLTAAVVGLAVTAYINISWQATLLAADTAIAITEEVFK